MPHMKPKAVEGVHFVTHGSPQGRLSRYTTHRHSPFGNLTWKRHHWEVVGI